jgi:hypothetical protein
MSNRTILCIGLLVCGRLAIGHAQTPLQPVGEIRRAVAAAAAAEIALYDFGSHSAPVSLYDFRFDLAMRVDSLQVWRAELIGIDHWHWYLIGWDGKNVYRLGGFEAPELISFSGKVTPAAPGDSTTFLRRARLFAKAADPEGSVQVVFPGLRGDSAQSVVLAQWNRMRPSEWLSDTVTMSGTGGKCLRLTMLSKRTRALTPVWVPWLYSLCFKPNGMLESWARSQGRTFGIRQTKRQ